MPFTFSHPAAVLPFSYLPKKWISMTGMIIGSLSPDFEYFIRMRVHSSYSHSWSGMFYFDLPMTIILTFIFHLFVRDSLIDNLPIILKGRLLIYKNFNWSLYFKNNFIVIFISILFGIATHIFWDGFTHKHGQFVQIIHGLNSNFMISGHSFPVYKLLQHSSTIIGGLIVIYALLQLPMNKNCYLASSVIRYWLMICLITLITVSIRILAGLDYRQYGDVLVTIISGGLLGLIITPKLLRLKY